MDQLTREDCYEEIVARTPTQNGDTLQDMSLADLRETVREIRTLIERETINGHETCTNQRVMPLPTALKTTAKILRSVRLNQPSVTLQEARAQAQRVMEAARRSPLRSQHSSIGRKKSNRRDWTLK